MKEIFLNLNEATKAFLNNNKELIMHTEKKFICRLCSNTLKYSSSQGIKQLIAHVRGKSI